MERSSYDLELERVIQEIKANKAKRICIQLPDGLKHLADDIITELEDKTDTLPIIWLGSCFGACDLPLNLNTLNIDMVVQWGHNRYIKSKDGW